MVGRFEGLTDLEWKLFDHVFPKEPSKRGKGMPHAPYRHVLNSLLYILITGCRWCDLPSGDIWASKSSSHRWLKRWRSYGTFEHIKARAYTFILWHQMTGGLRRRWANKPLNTFTEALEAFRTAVSYRFFDWLTHNRDVFTAYIASLGYIWA